MKTSVYQHISAILETKSREELANLVEIFQGQGISGVSGTWEQFLRTQDQQYGQILFKPSSRPRADLLAFLKTIYTEENLKLLASLLRPARLRVTDYSSPGANLQVLLDDEFPSPGIDLFTKLFIAEVVTYNQESKFVQKTANHPDYHFDYLPMYDPKDWVTLGMEARQPRTPIPDLRLVSLRCVDGTKAPLRVVIYRIDSSDTHSPGAFLSFYVKPDAEIADFQTETTGITSEFFESVRPETVSLAAVQNALKEMCHINTFLIGHCLHKDLKALKVDFPKVIDISVVFEYSDPNLGRPPLDLLIKLVAPDMVLKDAHDRCLTEAKLLMILGTRLRKGVLPTPIQVTEEILKAVRAKEEKKGEKDGIEVCARALKYL